jgi:hypothetical protein
MFKKIMKETFTVNIAKAAMKIKARKILGTIGTSLRQQV